MENVKSDGSYDNVWVKDDDQGKRFDNLASSLYDEANRRAQKLKSVKKKKKEY